MVLFTGVKQMGGGGGGKCFYTQSICYKNNIEF